MSDHDHELIRQARSLLANLDPFFATIAYNLEIHREDGIPTMGTDGAKLFYNLKFVEALKKQELINSWRHEIGHIIFRHHTRRGNRNPMKWNIAGDIVINLMLEKCGYDMSFMDRFSIPMAFARQFEGLTTEEVYNKLPDEQCPSCGDKMGDHTVGPDGKVTNGKGQPCKLPKCGCIKDAGKTKEELEKADAEAEVLINQAEQVVKMQQGNLPAGLDRLLGQLKQTKLDYRDILPEFIQTSVNHDDIDWLKPVRRMFGAGYYIPRLYNPTIDDVAVGLDTSGSIGGAILEQFFGEVQGVFEQLRPKSLILVDCDAAVHQVRTLTIDDFPIPVGMNAKGGGGTDFRPVFEYFEKQETKPTCLIYLTDLYGTFPDEAPEYPVLWVVYGNPEGVAPFGLTAYIKE